MSKAPDPDASADDRMTDPGAGAPVADLPAWVPRGFLADAPPRPTPARVVAAVLSVVLVVALLAWALPWATGTGWSGILASIASLPPWAIPAVALLGAGALLLEAVTVRGAVRGARWGPALRSHAVNSGLSLAVPGGSTLGLAAMAWILRRSGLALPVILTGIIAASLVETALTSLGIPLLGLAAYALSAAVAPAGIDLPGALWAAVLAMAGGLTALALIALLLRRGVLAGVLDQLGAIVPERVGRSVLGQRDALVGLLRRRTLPLVVPTLLARVLQWLALLVSIRAVGAEISLLLTVAVFALSRLLAQVPLTPGGAGITETVGAAALVALGVAAADAATAMLLLGVATLLVPLLAGSTAIAVSLGRGRSSGSAADPDGQSSSRSS